MSQSKIRGFSLLEMLVAVAVLGVTMGALYEAVGGATRNVRIDEKYSYAIVLAESLLANYSVVPAYGLSESGETSGGFKWSVQANPNEGDYPRAMKPNSLQDITVSVKWQDGEKERSYDLSSVVVGWDKK